MLTEFLLMILISQNALNNTDSIIQRLQKVDRLIIALRQTKNNIFNSNPTPAKSPM